MAPQNDVESSIKRLRRRVRLLLVERWALYGAAAGTLAAAVLAGLSFRYDGLLNYALWAAVPAAGALIGAIVALVLRIGDLTIAASADRRTGLKERLSTAVSLLDAARSTPSPLAGVHPERSRREGRGEGESFCSAVIADAAEHISPLRSREVFRHRFGRPHAVFGIAAVVLLGVILIPQIPGLQSQQRRAEVAVMKKEGAKIKKLGKEIEKQTNTDQKELRKLAKKLEMLGWKMQTGRMTKKQAMLQTRRLSDQVKREQDRLAKENSRTKSMEQAQAEMRESTQDLAKRAADEIARKENIPPEEALKKVPSDKRLAELARKDGPLTASERKELEDAIKKYADPNNSQPIPAELGEALAKLAQNKEYRKAAELMQKLSQKLNLGKMSKMDQALLKKQMEQLAKALKNTDLDKLAKQMLANAEKLAKMSPEELEKLIKQAEKMQKMAQMLAKAGGT